MDNGSEPAAVDGQTSQDMTEGTKLVGEFFRLPASEHEQVQRLIVLAHKLGFIKKPSLQEFMVFAINCAFTYVKEEFRNRSLK